MRLVCYSTSSEKPRISAAPLERDWMDRTGGSAYRCLPLNIANTYGWVLLNTKPVLVKWDGGDARSSIDIQPLDSSSGYIGVESHFGFGVLTFRISALFETEPGYDLFVSGPTNTIKDGIQPLTGIVEADWAPFTFTMNWKFTRPHAPVSFLGGEPICMLFPIKRGFLEEIRPELKPLAAAPEKEREYRDWTASRAAFIKDLKIAGSEAARVKWQKEYFRGQSRFRQAPTDHRTRLRLFEFE
jgi:hypothetical protein